MPWYYKTRKNAKVVLDKGTSRLHCAHIIADLRCIITREFQWLINEFQVYFKYTNNVKIAINNI